MIRNLSKDQQDHNEITDVIDFILSVRVFILRYILIFFYKKIKMISSLWKTQYASLIFSLTLLNILLHLVNIYLDHLFIRFA